MQYEFPFQDALDKLNVLLSQNQFELLVPNTAVSSQQTSDIRLVYLMNDAVESFLVFKEAVLTGTYLKEYDESWRQGWMKVKADMCLQYTRERPCVRCFFRI